MYPFAKGKTRKDIRTLITIGMLVLGSFESDRPCCENEMLQWVMDQL